MAPFAPGLTKSVVTERSTGGVVESSSDALIACADNVALPLSSSIRAGPAEACFGVSTANIMAMARQADSENRIFVTSYLLKIKGNILHGSYCMIF